MNDEYKYRETWKWTSPKPGDLVPLGRDTYAVGPDGKWRRLTIWSRVRRWASRLVKP